MAEIIAEVGKNFVTTEEERPIPELLKNAKQLIRSAKACGCDLVKFQVHSNDEIHPQANMVSPHFNHDRKKWVERNTYPESFWWDLILYCREIEIEFLATPMSRGAAQLLHNLGVDRWKIGSGDILDFVMLDYIRDTGKPVILSSGMSSLGELRKSYNFIKEKVHDVTILHCVSIYPCPVENLGLSTITYLKKTFPEAKIGFSDHSTDIDGSLMAVRLGAEVIEKHFTFNVNAWGPDHKVSIEPYKMKTMVRQIRDGMLMTPPEGIETKYIQTEEMAFRPIFRKGLFASRHIKKDETFERDMIFAMRPRGDARPSEEYEEVLGTFNSKPLEQYETIT